MAKMYLMSGLSGSGKTTYARKFAADNDLLYLNVDDFYAVWNGSPTIHEHEFEVWIAFYQAIHCAEIAGRDCIVDTNALTAVDRIQFLNWFPTFEHHLIWIEAPIELCVENNNNRARVVPIAELEKMYHYMEYPTANEDARRRWKSIKYVMNNDNTEFRERYTWRNY